MSKLAPLFSSVSQHWSTPKSLYDQLDLEFHFNFDPCPLYGKDGLTTSWKGKRVFCNPPYGPKIKEFLAKWSEAELVVFLLPARTDTTWFHALVLPKAKEIRFLRGRLRFGNAKNGAPFPSMVVVFREGA